MEQSLLVKPYSIGSHIKTTSHGSTVIPSPYYTRSGVIQFLRDKETQQIEDLTAVSPHALPGAIAQALSVAQCDGLAFAYKKFVIAGEPKIQTFQMGSATKGKGTMKSIGLERVISQNWSVFGSVSGINLKMSTANTFRTDIQIRLENTGTGERLFFERSVPFPITVSMDRGDAVNLYYAKGGLTHPAKGDFRINVWIPFLLENVYTKQIVPLASIPSFVKPKFHESLWFVAIFVTLIFPPLAMAIALLYLIARSVRDRKWKKDLELANIERLKNSGFPKN